jgi:CheY-like chemotaxis protein
MKIEYNILWLDDAKQEIEEGEYHIELFDFVKSLNFLPNIELVRTEKEFFEILNQKQWDLIMTDYNLDEISENPEKGDEVIEKVREKDVLTEILFYTKKDDENRKVGFDRITFIDTSKMSGTIHNEKVVSKAKEIVELTVRKFQNIIVMRGMIMHQTSSLDVEMIEIIKKVLENDSINFEEVSVSIYDQLIELFTQKTEFVQECKQKMNFNQLTKDNFVYSAKYKILTLSKILEDLEMEDFSTEYDTEINSIRNKFAHAVLEKDDNGREFFKYKEEGINFNEELCKKIRLNIIKHKNNLDLLKQKLLSK